MMTDTFDDPQGGEKTWLGVYATPQQVASMLRDLADAMDNKQHGWGAIVNACFMVHSQHPLWRARADTTITLNFRDTDQSVRQPLVDRGLWMSPDQDWPCGASSQLKRKPAKLWFPCESNGYRYVALMDDETVMFSEDSATWTVASEENAASLLSESKHEA